MSNKSQIQKDRLYFTQNNCKIRVRCPECVRTKILRHCKVYKNLPALWWHIKREHASIANLDFDIQDIIEVLNDVDRALKWKIIE